MNAVTPLFPLKEIATVQGIVSWSDDRRKIIINKSLRVIYSELSARTLKVNYNMEFSIDKEKLINRLFEHLNENRYPIFLFFYKDDGEIAE